MAMNEDETTYPPTQHALLVVWGEFARQIGRIEAMDNLSIAQRRREHTPQTKVLEFFIANLVGLKHLEEISRAAHPLDQDQEVARAWGRVQWADYSGVSRTLSRLSQAEADQIVSKLEAVSQVFIDREVNLALLGEGRLIYDGDLTGIPVCKSSKTYPETAYGHMDDQIKLGYQACVISLRSPSYGRLWLSVEHRPGNTVAATQVEGMIHKAEARTGVRPLRRTELLAQRLAQVQQQGQKLLEKREARQLKVIQAQAAQQQVEQEMHLYQEQVDELETTYQLRECLERPTSRLGLAHQRLAVFQRRLARRQKALIKAQSVLEWTAGLLAQQQQEENTLRERLERFTQENVANPNPIRAVFRLDAGFGTYENLALLIEMGYEVYTKLQNQQIVRNLQKQIPLEADWTLVGPGVQMISCSSSALETFAYSVDVGLEHFTRESKTKYSALLHFGPDPVAQDLPGWFNFYNHRQTIEAGIKESKQVFYLHRIKVRSIPAICLQEFFVAFAANFIRWARLWLYDQQPTRTGPQALPVLSLKKLVHVACHTSASLISTSDGKLLRFSDQSVFAGKELKLPCFAHQLPLPFFKNYDFSRV
jgi:hypothetical protein